MIRVSVQPDDFVGVVCARRGQYLMGVMYLGGAGRARPEGEKVHPDRSTWPSGLIRSWSRDGHRGVAGSSLSWDST